MVATLKKKKKKTWCTHKSTCDLFELLSIFDTLDPISETLNKGNLMVL